MYNEAQANSTHIKIQNPYNKDDDNDKNLPTGGGGMGGGMSENDTIIANESGDTWRKDAEGIYYPGYFDDNNIWHDYGTQIFYGNNFGDTYVLPINPVVPNFTPVNQPSTVFGW